MSRAPSFCAVLLASADLTPTGEDKALRSWPPTEPDSEGAAGETFLSATIAAFNEFADMVIVVVGANETALAPVIYAHGGQLVRNLGPSQEPFAFLQAGLREVLNRGRDAAMLTFVECPPARGETLRTLLTTFDIAASREKWAVIPEYHGAQGYPILLGREMIEAMLRAPETSTALEIQRRNVERIEYVAVEDSYVTTRVNTPDDYAALRVPH